MRIIKKTITLYLSIPPINSESEPVYAHANTYPPHEAVDGTVIKAFNVTVDVPVRYEQLPESDVKEIAG